MSTWKANYAVGIQVLGENGGIRLINPFSSNRKQIRFGRIIKFWVEYKYSKCKLYNMYPNTRGKEVYTSH